MVGRKKTQGFNLKYKRLCLDIETIKGYSSEGFFRAFSALHCPMLFKYKTLINSNPCTQGGTGNQTQLHHLPAEELSNSEKRTTELTHTSTKEHMRRVRLAPIPMKKLQDMRCHWVEPTCCSLTR